MDNNFENNFDNNPGNQPQRPFTERPDERNAQPFEFNPEKPLMQNPQNPQNPQTQQAPSEDQGFNPIEQTATYQDGAFNQPARNPQQYAPPYKGYQPQQPNNAQYTD